MRRRASGFRVHPVSRVGVYPAPLQGLVCGDGAYPGLRPGLLSGAPLGLGLGGCVAVLVVGVGQHTLTGAALSFWLEWAMHSAGFALGPPGLHPPLRYSRESR